jgi:hypothetical protein
MAKKASKLAKKEKADLDFEITHVAASDLIF